MEKIQVKFRGIDRFNRPVFKVIDKNIYIGDTNNLFSYDSTGEQVKKYYENNISELVYFGEHFNCEPSGTSLKFIPIII